MAGLCFLEDCGVRRGVGEFAVKLHVDGSLGISHQRLYQHIGVEPGIIPAGAAKLLLDRCTSSTEP